MAPLAPKSLLVIAAALLLSACGRTPLSALTPPANPEAPRYTPANDPAAAVGLARAAIGAGAAEVRYLAAYGVTEGGRLDGTHRAGWVVGLTDGGKAKLVTVNWLGQTRAVPAKLPDAAATAPLALDALPPAGQAVSWAHQAGLAKSQTYQVSWMGHPKGAVLGVSETTALGAERATDDVALILLDAATGKSLTPVVTDAAPTAPVDTPEGAATVAMKALSIGRGR